MGKILTSPNNQSEHLSLQWVFAPEMHICRISCLFTLLKPKEVVKQSQVNIPPSTSDQVGMYVFKKNQNLFLSFIYYLHA